MQSFKLLNRFILISLALLGLSVSQANAAVVGFESITVGECSSHGSSLSTEGFDFLATSNSGSARFLGCTGTPLSNGNRFSNNGTNMLGLGFAGTENIGATYSFERTDQTQFSLISLDYAEFFEIGDFAFDANATSLVVNGVRNNLLVASETLILDLFSDGPGGGVDFQTFFFSIAFQNLDAIQIGPVSTLGAGGNFGNAAMALIDNITYQTVAVVPIPAAVWLFGTALIGFVGISRRRKVA